MPQPIDPHTELARMTATERIQQLADRANLAVQARVANDAAQQRVAAESQVAQSKSKSDELDRELRRRNPFVGRRKRRQKGEAPFHATYSPHERRGDAAEEEEHDLDITI